MLSAKEAREKVILQTKCEELLKIIEKCINRAVERNWCSTSVPVNGLADDVKIAILNKLESLGYVAEYVPPKPLPSGCPSDQWDFHGYLKISWEE